MNFFIVSGGQDICRVRPAEGIHAPSATSVSPGKEKITSSQKSLSDMQIARLVLSEVNDKNALCCTLPPRANGDWDKVP
jgi:hypothetical protein